MLAQVSIHTPTQGVTNGIFAFMGRRDVSIHTPTQGVTRNTVVITLFPSCFNPHTHAGCDPVNTAAYTRIKVSIHTPTQGVTGMQSVPALNLQFQSTHPRRV